MDAHELISSFAEFAKQKNIDRPTMIRILEDVFRNMIRKKYESDENFDIIINADKGDLEIYRFREIVDDDSEDIWDFDKVSLTEARKIEPDFEVGEEVSEQVYIEDFGRRAVTTARQTLIQKVKDLEKDILFQKYKDLVGEIITGEVYQVLSKEVLLTDGEGNEIAIFRAGNKSRKTGTAKAKMSELSFTKWKWSMAIPRSFCRERRRYSLSVFLSRKFLRSMTA
jgi:transcription termination/antitermination protein NusA